MDEKANPMNVGGDKKTKTMDEERHSQTAYHYLCHLEATRRWIENCLGEELPESIDMERYLSNGVYLARLSKYFDEHELTQKAKIYDLDMQIFESKGLMFRHTDNINHWFRAMNHINVPSSYIPETSDLYNQKNMPKVIYCIHALSHIIYRLGLGSKIKNLVGKVDFSDADISAIETALARYGVKLPQFSKIGGALAKELSSDLAGMHAAILAINAVIEKKITAETIAALKMAKARLDHINDQHAQLYQDGLLKYLLRKKANSVKEVEHGADDIYMTNLTQEEIQNLIDKINHEEALRKINTNIAENNHVELAESLLSEYAIVRSVKPALTMPYMLELRTVYSRALESDKVMESSVDDLEYKVDAATNIQALTSVGDLNEENYRVHKDGHTVIQKSILTLQQVQKVISLINERHERLFKSHSQLYKIKLCQRAVRAYLDRKREEKEDLVRRQNELEKQRHLQRTVTIIQSWARGNSGRKKSVQRRTEQQRLVNVVEKLYFARKEKLRLMEIRREIIRRRKFLAENVAYVVLIQAWYRGRRQGILYKELKSAAPSLAATKSYITALCSVDHDTMEEIECRNLNLQVVKEINNIQVLEESLLTLDLKIGLLVRNKISMEEAAATSRKTDSLFAKTRLKSRKNIMPNGHSVATNQSRTSPIETKTNLDSYKFLFHLLQTNTEYLARLVFLIPQNSNNRFIENVVMSTFAYGQCHREEWHLLKLFKKAITEQVQEMSTVQELTTGQPTVIKMVVGYTRGLKERQYLTSLLGECVRTFIEKQNDLIQVCPKTIYRWKRSEDEVMSGDAKPFKEHITEIEALEYPGVVEMYTSSIISMQTHIPKFIDEMIKNMDSMPGVMKSICMHVRQQLTEKFGNECEDEILKAVGNILINKYMCPAIVNPDKFDIWTTEPELTVVHRKNLGEISKMLILASTGSQDYEESLLGNLMKNSWERLRFYFDEISKDDGVKKYRLDDSDVSSTLPHIFISPQDVYNTQYYLTEHLDEMNLLMDDELRIILKNLPDAELLNYGPGDDWFTTPQLLQLAPSNCMNPLGEAEQASSQLFTQIKAQIITLLSYETADTLTQLIEKEISDSSSRKHDAHCRARRAAHIHGSRSSLQSVKSINGYAVQKSKGTEKGTVTNIPVEPCLKASENIAQSKLETSSQHQKPLVIYPHPDVRREISVAKSINWKDLGRMEKERITLSMKSLQDMQESVAAGMVQLEKDGLVSSTNDYQLMKNAIAKDILKQTELRRLRKEAHEKMVSTLAELAHQKKICHSRQLEFQKYLETCVEKQNPEKKKKELLNRLTIPRTKEKHPYGYVKISAKKLIKNGILISIDGAEGGVKGLEFTISSDEHGVFQLVATWLAKKIDVTETIHISDLLQSKSDGRVIATCGPVKYHVNLMLHFLNTKFYQSSM
eukprot:CFRG1841T1